MYAKTVASITVFALSTGCAATRDAVDQNTTEIQDNTAEIGVVSSEVGRLWSTLGPLIERVENIEDRMETLESNGQDVGDRLSELRDTIDGIPTFAWQRGRLDGTQTFRVEDATRSAWQNLSGLADELQLQTTGGDVIVHMHFPVIMREARVQFGVTVDQRPQGPVKHCGVISAREPDTVEFDTASCTMVFSDLPAGTHKFAPSLIVEGDYIEAQFGLRYAMTAIEVL
ncbi:MAG: hypothetical protein AB8H79_13415 [Myxococcota bacterium]